MQEDESIAVTVAVLGSKESEQIFGAPLSKHNIQPVWVRIRNDGELPYLFSPVTIDPEYYSALEASHKNHFSAGMRALSYGLAAILFLPLVLIVPFQYFSAKSANKKMDKLFEELDLQTKIIMPGKEYSGFVFTHLDQGTKEVFIALTGEAHDKEFRFFIPVPDLKPDHQSVEFERLYPEKKIVSYDAEELRIRLEQLPCCTTEKKGKNHGDPLNLVLIGEFETILNIFTHRDWDETEPVTFGSSWKTMKSFLFGRKYRYSPMSSLYLFGRGQDVGFQKARESINERNHLRLWYTPMRFEGKPVWVGQISRDIGVRFTFKTWNLTTHKIDPDVDEARNALLADLMNSGLVSRVGLVEGVGAAASSKPKRNLTGDPYHTDGRRGVVVLSDTKERFRSFGWSK
jgi:hypothetical protein